MKTALKCLVAIAILFTATAANATQQWPQCEPEQPCKAVFRVTKQWDQNGGPDRFDVETKLQFPGEEMHSMTTAQDLLEGQVNPLAIRTVKRICWMLQVQRLLGNCDAGIDFKIVGALTGHGFQDCQTNQPE